MMRKDHGAEQGASIIPFDPDRRGTRPSAVLRSVRAAAAALTAPETPAERAAGRVNEALAAEAGAFLISGGRDRLAIAAMNAFHSDVLAAIGPAYTAQPDLVAGAVLAHTGAILEASDVIGPFPDTQRIVTRTEQHLTAALAPSVGRDAGRTTLG